MAAAPTPTALPTCMELVYKPKNGGTVPKMYMKTDGSKQIYREQNCMMPWCQPVVNTANFADAANNIFSDSKCRIPTTCVSSDFTLITDKAINVGYKLGEYYFSDPACKMMVPTKCPGEDAILNGGTAAFLNLFAEGGGENEIATFAEREATNPWSMEAVRRGRFDAFSVSTGLLGLLVGLFVAMFLQRKVSYTSRRAGAPSRRSYLSPDDEEESRPIQRQTPPSGGPQIASASATRPLRYV